MPEDYSKSREGKKDITDSDLGNFNKLMQLYEHGLKFDPDTNNRVRAIEMEMHLLRNAINGYTELMKGGDRDRPIAERILILERENNSIKGKVAFVYRLVWGCIAAIGMAILGVAGTILTQLIMHN